MVPLSIAPAHGEEDSRIPVCKALQLWDIASKRVYMELMVCELEGRATVRVFPCLVGVRDLCPGGSADYFFWHCSGVQAEERD
jgi:hypothetical protein